MTHRPNMSPPKPPMPLDHHIFISNNDNLDSDRLLLGLALHTSTAPTTVVFDHLSSLSPTTSHAKHTSLTSAYEKEQPSLTLSLLFPASTTTLTQQQQKMSSKEDITSFSNSVSIKREREDLDQDATGTNDLYEDVSNYIDNLSNGGGGTSSRNKKKLRLNKQQSALLEDNFKLHTTLNPKQKEALARQLNLLPRQVEVWFQNRRARTKLKQTEVDCEFLKKCCERLAEENKKLNKELQHLKSLNKIQQVPFHNMHHLPPASRLTSTYMCPSCHNHQKLLPPNNNTNNLLISSKKRFIFNPFTKAC